MTTTRTEIRDDVAWIHLDNAPVNGLFEGMVRELTAELRRVNAIPSVRAIVLTGSGAAFCGGVDPTRLDRTRPTGMAEALLELFAVIPDEVEVPVIVAANGDALASGFSLVCLADAAVCVESASLGTYEAAVGMWPAIAQVPVLHRIATRPALQNIMTGVPFSAARALELGIVNEIVDTVDDLQARAQALALAMSVSPHTRAGRASAQRLLQLPYRDALDASLSVFVELMSASKPASSE